VLQNRDKSIDDFKNSAYQILTNVGMVPSKINSIVDGLLTYYCGDNRYYHNEFHINYMLENMRTAGWESNALSFAILFHDIFYIPCSAYRVNERISADLAVRELSDCLYCDSIEAESIYNMILATSDFMESCHNNINCQMICDLDLSSLARTVYEDFVLQQTDIIMEMGLDSSNLDKSAKFLKLLCDSRGDDLFYTEYAKDNWMTKAKSNINVFYNDYNR